MSSYLQYFSTGVYNYGASWWDYCVGTKRQAEPVPSEEPAPKKQKIETTRNDNTEIPARRVEVNGTPSTGRIAALKHRLSQGGNKMIPLGGMSMGRPPVRRREVIEDPTQETTIEGQKDTENKTPKRTVERKPSILNSPNKTRARGPSGRRLPTRKRSIRVKVSDKNSTTDLESDWKKL
mmetsp:Transcript_30092/g.33614  ORF Transcript_30092/g.33614 Transcript_30092/m.33614 type:complete len:179 (+) Transcript_30092:58-594(+)